MALLPPPNSPLLGRLAQLARAITHLRTAHPIAFRELTDDQQLAERCRSLRNLCFKAEQRFVHDELGWNLRMSNLQAALEDRAARVVPVPAIVIAFAMRVSVAHDLPLSCLAPAPPL